MSLHIPVTIGQVTISGKYVRRITQAIGGYVGIYASALDEEGGALKNKIEKLEKGKVYELWSIEASGIVKVISVKTDTKEEGGRKIHMFTIELQIIA